MRERPILFTGPMVRAILAGQKTQTRRPVKPQPQQQGESIAWLSNIVGRPPSFAVTRPASSDVREIACPYGAPGDRLWVRETFALSIRDPDSAFPADAKDPSCWDGAVYRADGEAQGGGWDRYEDGKVVARGIAPPWKPAIHMPRWACRLVLEVTAVRVERLRDLALEHGDAAARAEGCADVADFMNRWGAMYGLDEREGSPFAWYANPWVWVVEFRRVEAAKEAA